MMLNEMKNRIRMSELLVIYGITLLLGIRTGIVYRDKAITEYLIGIAGSITAFIAIFLPYKMEAHITIFIYFVLGISACWHNPQLCTLLAVSSVILCCFPEKPEQFQRDIIVCGLIMLFFTNNFIPLLLLFELLMGLDMFLDLREYAKSTGWKLACTTHHGRAKWMGIALLIFVLGTVKFIMTTKEVIV